MQLSVILIILSCLWCLTHLWLLPLAKENWAPSDIRQKVGRAGTLVVLEKIRDISAAGIVALAFVLLLVGGGELIAVVPFAAPKAIIEALASSYESMKALAEGYATALVWFGIGSAAIALYVSARRAKRRVTQAWSAKAGEVYERLQENPAEIDKAREQPELRPIVEKIDNLLGVFESLAEDESSGAERDAVARQISYLLTLLAVEMAKGEVEFGKAIASPDQDEAQPTPKPKERWLGILTSQRLAEDLGLIERPLSLLITGLLLISLLGWSAEPLANSLQLAVNNLRVNLLAKDAKRDLETAISKRKPQPEPAQENQSTSASVQATTQRLAQGVTRGLIHSGLADHIRLARREGLGDAELVRTQILEGQPHVPAKAKTAPHVVPDQAILRLTDHFEQTLQPELERLQKNDPGLFAKLATRLEARYGTPISPLDAQGEMIAKVLDAAVDAVDLSPSTELGKQSQQVLGEFGKKSVKTWTDAYARNYLTDLIMETAHPEVVRLARKEFGFEVSGETEHLAMKMQTDLDQAESRVSRAVAEKVALFHTQDEAERLAVIDRLAGYDHLFPAANDDVVHQGVGPIGPSGERPLRAKPPGELHLRARATSFHLASRSFRVRGVLFGQDLQPDSLSLEKPDIRDLQWTLEPRKSGQPTRLTLTIRLKDGSKRLGEFDAGVVNQAVRYAADRRVIATTITPGDGKIIERLTYLHPALIDTPLGCRVVEADRFIDTYTASSSGRDVLPDLRDIAAERRQISLWMQSVSVAERIAGIPTTTPCPLDKKLIARVKPQQVAFSAATAESLQAFLDKREAERTGSTAFLRSATECATGSTEKLADCWCGPLRKTGLAADYWFPEDHTSQFRERQMPLTADLVWMEPSKDHLTHIDFWLHTTFALRHGSSSAEAMGSSDETTATPLDFPGKQLARLKKVIGASLPKYLEQSLNSPSYDDFMKPLEDFVLLQRFVRAALNKQLGKDFPLSKLVQLERDTREFVPYQPTIRWEPAGKTSYQALVDTLNEVDPDTGQVFQAWAKDSYDRELHHMAKCETVSN